MNTAPGRSLAAILALLFLPVAAQSAPKPGPPGHARTAKFQIYKQSFDGPWLVPTLHAGRSASEWNAQMDTWALEEKVVGKEAAPDVDWSHQAVIVLSLGKQVGNCTMSVSTCTVDADVTLMELHFVTPTQWDPNGDVVHPAVLITVERSDLKNLEITTDCTVDGLPDGSSRRGSGLTAQAQTTADNATLTLDGGRTTWGRVKDAYRR